MTEAGPTSSSAPDGAYLDSSDEGEDATGLGSCPPPGFVCGAACVPSDVHNCGACGNDCTNLAHVSGSASCTAGACAFAAAACAPGWADCNGTADDGCETDLSQAATCGGCKTACTGTTPVCGSSGGTYACATACPAETPTACGTTCVNTASSATDCDGCGKACTTTVAHAQAACASGACSLTCNAGYTPCGGACFDVTSDTGNCGACGNACTALAHVSGAATCSAGACSFAESACAPGWADCNRNPADGCETDLSQATTCGGCQTVCPTATPVCSAGSGGTYACASGCPSATPTLCGATCVSTTSNASNCGACGEACTTTVTNAQAACTAGACTFTCNTGYTNCSGACVDEQTDANNCGGCGASCKGLPHVSGTATCGAGACTFGASACAAGWANCNGNAADGCETDLSKVASCGSCTRSCSGGTPVCSGSGGTYACVSGCPSNAPTLCGMSCVDPTTSVSNCGTCGTMCTTNVMYAMATCSGGTCGVTCDTGYTLCNGACVDEASNNDNCGGCGTVCGGGTVCQNGKCVCQAGSHSCGGTCVTNMSTSSCGPTSCAMCSMPQNSTPTCNGTSCGFNCDSGYTDCNGMCLNVKSSDNSNCGGCGVTCGSGTSCVAGTCTCNSTCPYGCCSGSTCSSPTQTWYYDGDKDGFGVSSNTLSTCAKPPDPSTGGTYVQKGGDCCDTDPRAFPQSTYCDSNPAVGCGGQSGGYDYNCNGESDKVACCTCDPSSGQCSNGWIGFLGCTPNLIITPDPTYGTMTDCGTLIMCVSDQGGCEQDSYAPAGDTAMCGGQIDYVLSAPCGQPVLYTSIDCDNTCMPSNPQYTAPTGINQGCQ